LEPNDPTTGSVLMPSSSTEVTMDRSRQYYWLDRFHEHLQQQQEPAMSTSEKGSTTGLSATTPKRSIESSSYTIPSCSEQNRASNQKPDDRASSNMV
jgi:hypothetical protein